MTNPKRQWLSKRLDSYGYLLLAGTASSIAALKGYVYSHLLSPLEFAQVNYYLLAVGVGMLLVSAGIMIRSQVVLPLMFEDPARDGELKRYIAQARGMGTIMWCVLALLAAVVVATPWRPAAVSPTVALLSVAQILLFFLFTMDLVIVKSRGHFYAYAKGMLVRNGLITLGGAGTAWIWPQADTAVMAEVLVCLALCATALPRWVKGITLPSLSFAKEGMKFVPVDIMGTLLQYLDRIAAAVLLPVADFSRYAYLGLVVMAGLSLQQLVNTRVITLMPVVCQRSPAEAFRYACKISGLAALVSMAGLSVAYLLLQSPWFSARWMGGAQAFEWLIIVIGILRSADFFTSYLIVVGRKRALFWLQLAAVAICAVASATYHFLLPQSVGGFLACIASAFALSYLLHAGYAWKASRDASR